MATKNWKTQLRYRITKKLEINNLTKINKTLTSKVIREKQRDGQSSTYFSSRNKIKVT